MEAGKLRHRITFQTRSVSQDAYGGQVDTWTDAVTNVAAAIEPLSVRELMVAQAAQNETRLKVSTRYFAGLTPAMRITYGSRIFNILGITNVEERNRELQFLCSEGLAKG